MQNARQPKELVGLEKRVWMLQEGRRAERIIKLHWLVGRRREVVRFLWGLRGEVAALRRELVEDHGLDGEDLRDLERPPRAD